VAEARVEEALAVIAEARHLLELGEKTLSGVHGVVYERKRLARLAGQVQLAWNDLVGRRDQLRRGGGLSLDELV
jgi:hypothetical protein